MLTARQLFANFANPRSCTFRDEKAHVILFLLLGTRQDMNPSYHTLVLTVFEVSG